jgi:molybdopterin-containing oxidoreductase family membrane subunit
MAKVMLAAGLVVAYGYLMEAFMAWYSGSLYEAYMLRNRVLGPYGPLYWLLLVCNVLIPQLLWLRPVRSNTLLLFGIAMTVNVGMWLERFIIVVGTLHRDFLPSAWANYVPTIWDWGTFIGTIGLFLTLLFLFIRFLPIISIFEMRGLLTETEPAAPEEGHAAAPAAVRPAGRI